MKRTIISMTLILMGGFTVLHGCGDDAGVALDSGSWRIEYRLDGKIYSIKSNGEDKRIVQDIPKQATRPYWNNRRSPRVDRWATVISWNGKAEIGTCGPEGEEPRKLTDNKARNIFAKWSPDGKKIVFNSNRSGTWQVWTMDADGANQIQITNHPKGAMRPIYSPDGNRIAYLANKRKQGPTFCYELMVADADGSNARVVAPKEEVQGFAWGRTENELIYSIIGTLIILDITTGSAVKAFDFMKIDNDFHYHGADSITLRPDGRAIACVVGFCGSRSAPVQTIRPGQKPKPYKFPPRYTGIFVIPLEGTERDIWEIEVGGEASPIRWVR
ncbi:MAG: TolB family protein [Planctomycetota bacterium]|jgi:WD40 repeat protein